MMLPFADEKDYEKLKIVLRGESINASVSVSSRIQMLFGRRASKPCGLNLGGMAAFGHANFSVVELKMVVKLKPEANEWI